MEIGELSQSQVPTVTSQDTRIARSTPTRISPGRPPGLFQRAAMRGSQSLQSQTLVEPIVLPEMSRRLARINHGLHLYEENLAQSIDVEHLAFQSVPPQIQHLVQELRKVQRDIMTGTRPIGTEMEQIETSIVQLEGATVGPQEGLKKLGGRIDGQDNRQTRHQQVTSQMHQTQQADGAVAMGRDEQL